MLRMFINNEEVVSDKVLEIKKEMLSTSSTILNNCYPKSWEDDKNYNSRFYFPKDYSLCTIKEGEFENGVQPYITKKASGINPTFETNLESPLESLTLYGKCEQDGASPSPEHPSEIKIVKGDENGNLKIKVTRKNLFNIGTDNGIRLNVSTIYNGSEYTLNGTTNSSGNLFSTLGSKPNYRYLGKYKAGTYHVKNYISGSVTIPPAKDFATYIRDDSNNLVVNMNRNKLIDNDFTLTHDTDLYIQMYTNSANIVFDNFNVKIQIEEGTVATEYEPYTEEVAKIDLKGNDLYSLPNGVKDELIIKEGTTKIIKRIGKVVLDGVHNGFDYKHPTLKSDNKGFYRFKLPGKSISYPSGEVGTALANYFVEVSGPAHIAFNNNSSGIWWEGRTEYAYIILEKTSLAEANNWLSTHNTTVYYELETPKEIDLMQTVAIKTYKGVNHIFNFGLETEMDVLYLYKNYDLLFAGIVKNTGNISLNPRHHHYSSLQILGFETFLSEGENLDFVIANKTITEAINMIIEVIKPYGFELGTVNIFRANDVIGAYSTLDKSPYDVFQYIADITGSRWRTRITDYNKIAIDFYDPTLMPRAENIQYSSDFFEENNIEDIYFSYNTGDYRNKQIILSNQVLADIEYETLLLADGYSKEFILEENLGKLIDIKVDGITKTFASDIDKKLGVTADFYYTVGKNNIESETVLPSNSNVYIKYVPIVKGRQIVYNNDEVNRISNQLEIKGIIARYENRNDSTSNAELNQIAQSYIKYKGSAEITLTLKTFNKDLFEVGEVTHFESPIPDLEKDYMIKKKTIQLIPTANYVFYTYEMSSNFNSEKAINYFDNQRAKLSGNIAEGDYIDRNIDFENTANIIFQNLTIEEITDTGSNTLDLILDGTL